jgi:Uma2 family endonuclease
MVTAPPIETDSQTLVIRRLTVEQYHRMGEVGILTEDDRVELLEGILVEKPMKNAAHSTSTSLTTDALRGILPSGWFIRIEQPLTTPESEPEPDLCIVRGSIRDYTQRHPYPNEVALIIEVSDSTLRQDRTIKLRIYAQAHIPVYWILNLPDQILEVYTQPAGEGANAAYRLRQVYHPSDTASVIIDGQEVGRVSVEELLA